MRDESRSDTASLELEDLSKNFGQRSAVRSVSFQVRRGEVFGLLGPNGAGKTTTIGMIAGIVPPSAGSFWLGGLEGGSAGARQRLGLVPQNLAFYPSMTARENLAFVGRVYGLSGESLSRRVERLLELAGLEARAREPVSRYSGGMMRRLNLVAGLVHEPEFLLLDEPTVGVDPQSRHRIERAMRELAARGLGLLLTTHYMEEAERLCDRVAIMDEGRIVAAGTVDELLALAKGKASVRLKLAQVPGPALLQWLEAKEASAIDDTHHHILADDVELLLPELLRRIHVEGNEVEDLSVHRPDLADVFLELTGKELRD